MTNLQSKVVDDKPISQKIKNQKDFHKFTWLKYELSIYFVFATMVTVYWLVDFYKASQTAVEKHKVVYGLQPGYFGLPRDYHDEQWRAWRSNLDLLLLAAVAHILLSQLIKRIFTSTNLRTPVLIYQLTFGMVYLCYLERAGLFLWLLFTGLFFLMIKSLYKHKYFSIILWGSALATLYFNEKYHGYVDFIFSSWKESIDNAPVKWNVIFNMTILRMISFGMDFYWSTKDDFSNDLKKERHEKTTLAQTYRQRQETSQLPRDYSLLAYYSYLAYVPLFLTGPIITFNAWNSQINMPQKAYTNKEVVAYGLKRLLFVFVCFEVFLHCFYVNAIATDGGNAHIWREDFRVPQLFVMGMLELFFLWFKFLIIWRYARLWALIDGVETPENMNRCIINNYNFENFWRSWHRSFNQWLIRYIFIPLGGSKYKLLNIWAVFSFVAIWHDMNLNLLMWSWIICLTLMPEMGIKWYFHREDNRYLWNKVWFRWLTAIASSFCVCAMVISNLIGYGTGYEGFIKIIDRIVHENGLPSVIGYLVWVFAHMNINFKLREKEAEKGDVKGF